MNSNRSKQLSLDQIGRWLLKEIDFLITRTTVIPQQVLRSCVDGDHMLVKAATLLVSRHKHSTRYVVYYQKRKCIGVKVAGLADRQGERNTWIESIIRMKINNSKLLHKYFYYLPFIVDELHKKIQTN